MEDETKVAEEIQDRGDELEDLDDELGTDEEEGHDDEGVREGQEGREEEIEAPKMIPKGRFDEKTRQLQEIKDENAWLKAQLEKAVGAPAEAAKPATPEVTGKEVETQIAEKRREYMTAIADGDVDAAIAIDDELTALQRQADEFRVQRYLEKALTERDVKRDLAAAEDVANQILAAHPELNSEKELYDEFLFARDYARHQGKTMTEALKVAEKRLFGKVRPADPASLTGEATPAKDPAQETVDKRKKEAVDRNIKAETTQPPFPEKGAGERMTSSKRRVRDMSDDEFDKLSATEKKALRGD